VRCLFAEEKTFLAGNIGTILREKADPYYVEKNIP